MSSWRLLGGLSEAVFAAWGGALQQQQQARVDFTRPADAYDSRREAVLSGSGTENDGFDLQTSYAAPLRPVLPRFPLLPVAMCLDHRFAMVSDARNVNARSDLDRLREPRAKEKQSLMQQAQL